MSNNKQSSVEWLYNKMYEHRGNITIEEFEQAKAMEKKQCVDFAEKAVRMVLDEDVQNPVSINQLYNETFNK
jgi:hypothetical protein